jgi:hypothetical protein
MHAASRPPATLSVSPASTSPSTPRTHVVRPAAFPGKVRPCCVGRCTKQLRPPRGRARPTTPTTSASLRGSGRAAPKSRSRASCCADLTTSCTSSATPRSVPRTNPLGARTAPTQSDDPRPTPERSGPAPAAPDRPSGRAHTFGTTRFTISSPTRPGSSTKIRSGAHAHPRPISALAHGPPRPTPALVPTDR